MRGLEIEGKQDAKDLEENIGNTMPATKYAILFCVVLLGFPSLLRAEGDRPYIGGAVILGACVMEHYNKSAKEYGDQLRKYIEDETAPSPIGTFPETPEDFRNFFNHLIGVCAESRYKAAYTTAALTLQREEISAGELEYFGKLVDENVLSIMMQEFAYSQ